MSVDATPDAGPDAAGDAGLREALAHHIEVEDVACCHEPEAVADRLIAGPLAQLLADRARLIAELDGLRAAHRAVEAKRDALAAALEPFAEAADNLDDAARDDDHLWESPEAMMLSAGDLRAARAALARHQDTGDDHAG